MIACENEEQMAAAVRSLDRPKTVGGDRREGARRAETRHRPRGLRRRDLRRPVAHGDPFGQRRHRRRKGLSRSARQRAGRAGQHPSRAGGRQAADVVRRAGLDGAVADVLVKLYRLFAEVDATLGRDQSVGADPLGRVDRRRRQDRDRRRRHVSADRLETARAAHFRAGAQPAGAACVGQRPPRHPRQRGPDVLRTGRRHHRAGLRRRHQRRGPRRPLPAGRPAGHLHRIQRQPHARKGQGADEDRAPVSPPDPRRFG